ncbi:MAG: hypothetical protein MUE40_10755 [Anaerolineae bacterium]|nr:hypothetical protein [Anaerolineae bacterium]
MVESSRNDVRVIALALITSFLAASLPQITGIIPVQVLGIILVIYLPVIAILHLFSQRYDLQSLNALLAELLSEAGALDSAAADLETALDKVASRSQEEILHTLADAPKDTVIYRIAGHYFDIFQSVNQLQQDALDFQHDIIELSRAVDTGAMTVQAARRAAREQQQRWPELQLRFVAIKKNIQVLRLEWSQSAIERRRRLTGPAAPERPADDDNPTPPAQSIRPP